MGEHKWAFSQIHKTLPVNPQGLVGRVSVQDKVLCEQAGTNTFKILVFTSNVKLICVLGENCRNLGYFRNEYCKNI